MASADTRMIGSLLGQAGVFDTTAVEMMRASGAAAPRLSRAVASRYFARYDSSRSRCVLASLSSARN